MAVLFIEPGGDATGDTSFWSSATNATIITASPITGSRSIQLAGGGVTRNSVMADAGRRVSVRVRLVSAPGSNQFCLMSSNFIAPIGITTDRKLFLYNNAVGTTVLALGTDYRISWAYKKVGTTEYIKVWINGVLEFDTSYTNTSTAGANLTINTGAGNTNTMVIDDIYVDDAIDATWANTADPGNIVVTAKRPNALWGTQITDQGEGNNSFDTVIGSGANRWSRVAEIGVAAGQANRYAHAATSAAMEAFAVESLSAGEVDISSATVLASVAWMARWRGSGASGGPAAMWHFATDAAATWTFVSDTTISTSSAVPGVVWWGSASGQNTVRTGSVTFDGVGYRSTVAGADTIVSEMGVVVAALLAAGPQTYNETGKQVTVAVTTTRISAFSGSELNKMVGPVAVLSAAEGLARFDNDLVVTGLATVTRISAFTASEIGKSVVGAATVTKSEAVSRSDLSRLVTGLATVSRSDVQAATEFRSIVATALVSASANRSGTEAQAVVAAATVLALSSGAYLDPVTLLAAATVVVQGLVTLGELQRLLSAVATVSASDSYSGTPPASGRTKVWDGSAFTTRPAKVWNGSSWVTRTVKVWNGSAWV